LAPTEGRAAVPPEFSQDDSVDLRQQAAIMLLRYVRNIVMAVWAALATSFKAISFL